MKIKQRNIAPITTPQHPDPTEKSRDVRDEDGVGFGPVFLEDAIGNALCEIADEKGCPLGQLCSDIEFNCAAGEAFAPSARRYVMRYLADIPDNIELPANFPVLTELLAAHRSTQ